MLLQYSTVEIFKKSVFNANDVKYCCKWPFQPSLLQNSGPHVAVI